MILRSLRLKNFRKFSDAYLEFPDGTTAVLGLNGAGKSSVFEAVGWALYGSVAARTQASQIKREGAPASEPCRVELEFLFDERLYRVVRELVGKNQAASATATVDGALAASGADSVSAFIQSRLGLDCKAFTTSIYARQKELNALSSMNPSERRPLILRMLGISALDDVIAAIRSDSRDTEKACDTTAKALKDEQGRSKVHVLQEKQASLQQRQATIAADIATQRDHLTTLEAATAQALSESERRQQLYEESQRRRDALEQQKRLFDKAGMLKERLAQLQKSMEERRRTLAADKAAVASVTIAEEAAASVEHQQKALADAHETIVTGLEQRRTHQQRLARDLAETQKKVAAITALGPDATCPTCDRVLGQQHQALLDAYTQMMTATQAEQQTLLAESRTLERDKAQLAKQREALQKKAAFLQRQRLEAEALKAKVRAAEQELSKEEAASATLAADLARLGPLSFKDQDYEAAQQSAKEAYTAYQASLKVVQERRSAREKHRLLVQRTEAEATMLSQQYAALTEAIAEQEKLQTQLLTLQRARQDLTALGEVMAAFRTMLISRIRPTLGLYASDLLAELTSGKYALVEFDEQYDMVVYDNGRPFAIERYSGGEEDLANLCTRLAVSEVIAQQAGSDLGVIILDEVFGSQDVHRRRNILSALGGLSNRFRQIFLITHVDDIKNSVENVVTVTEDESGVSRITVD